MAIVRVPKNSNERRKGSKNSIVTSLGVETKVVVTLAVIVVTEEVLAIGIVIAVVEIEKRHI